MEKEFKIKGLVMDPVNNSPIIILQDAGSDTLLPIWVGIFEANAIALQIEKVDPPRPMTHDLLKSILGHLSVDIDKIVITELRDSTFYALIYLNLAGKTVTVDSRPSDAIALALRTDSPIFVDEDVIAKSRTQSVPPNKEKVTEDLRRWLEDLDVEDLGKYKM
ncbi:MAG: bifunctional nuclease family protein [Acidobacteria bacterium]|nr:bifunctional nuclease family protein [Acidobacteriota bacterium]MBI3656735.1 bifunctional nuclease family protein [Acidobacteriota bacterium]